MREAFVALIAAVVLVGCGGASVAVPESERNAFAEGCRAGTQVGGLSNDYVTRNPGPRYEADPDYRKAWDTGFRQCFDRAIANPRRR